MVNTLSQMLLFMLTDLKKADFVICWRCNVYHTPTFVSYIGMLTKIDSNMAELIGKMLLQILIQKSEYSTDACFDPYKVHSEGHRNV